VYVEVKVGRMSLVLDAGMVCVEEEVPLLASITACDWPTGMMAFVFEAKVLSWELSLIADSVVVGAGAGSFAFST